MMGRMLSHNIDCCFVKLSWIILVKWMVLLTSFRCLEPSKSRNKWSVHIPDAEKDVGFCVGWRNNLCCCENENTVCPHFFSNTDKNIRLDAVIAANKRFPSSLHPSLSVDSFDRVSYESFLWSGFFECFNFHDYALREISLQGEGGRLRIVVKRNIITLTISPTTQPLSWHFRCSPTL